MAGGTIESLPTPTVGAPVVLVHTLAPEPRYNLVPTVDGNAVVQHMGYVRRKLVTVLWANDPALVEEKIRELEVDGYVREGSVNINMAVHEMVCLYNATATLVKYAPTGALS